MKKIKKGDKVVADLAIVGLNEIYNILKDKRNESIVIQNISIDGIVEDIIDDIYYVKLLTNDPNPITIQLTIDEVCK